jgi:hypothetical protein
VKKRVAVVGAIAAMLGGIGAFAFAPSADADPSVCIEINLNLNGTPVMQALCLPPDGAPGVPGGLPVPVPDPGGLPVPPLPVP